MNFRTKLLLLITAVCTLIAGAGLLIPKVGEALRLTGGAAGDRPQVIVDPGHGGIDGGAVTADGFPEKEINLPLALKLRDLLTLMGYDVIMTRETDVSIHDPEYQTVRRIKTSDLKNRMKIMETYPRALFISIHQNKFPGSKYWGTQVFYAPRTPESKLLADNIQLAVKRQLQPENSRETKKSGKNIYLLYEAQSTAVMVECGFLSNSREAALLRTEEYQSKLAFAVLCGVLNYSSGQDAPENAASSAPGKAAPSSSGKAAPSSSGKSAPSSSGKAAPSSSGKAAPTSSGKAAPTSSGKSAPS